MAQFKPVRATEKNINQIQIQDGQLILTEEGNVYADFPNGERIKCSSQNNQIQSDWEQTDNTQKDYIKNKPDILDEAEIVKIIEQHAIIGENGATFIPAISENGIISWTNDKDLNNPPPINIKGPQGLQGEIGYYIKATVDRPSFSESQWTTYGTIGREENWGGTSNADVRVGDLFIIVGTSTDAGQGHLLVYKYTGVKGGNTLSGTCIGHHIISAKGATGAAGKSAYATAKEGGYTGTEQQFATKLATTYPKPSITDYPKLSGESDDTERFQRALAENDVLYVPGGEYKLSDTLTIRQNCELELAQDVILDFQQMEGDCIELRSSSTLRGNHGILRVPPRFTGNVIGSTTTNDTKRDTPPYKHWDPQWKRARYIYDINIIKPETTGLHYIAPGEPCTGNGIYLSCDGNSEVRFMWGVLMYGIRISGSFANGIRVANYDLPTGPEDNAWNHDMRIEAVIECCETAVNLTNCNGPRLAVTVQPHCASDEKTPYAKWGVRLEDCKFVDMSSAAIWDWNASNSLFGEDEQYTSVAMYGDCSGLILYDYAYYRTSFDVRERIYSDPATNLERMVVVQEPITKWFKPIEGKPYFNSGLIDEPLLLKSSFDNCFDLKEMPTFTEQLSIAQDFDGSIFNGIGYRPNARLNFSDGASIIESTDGNNYYTCTGLIPCQQGSIIRIKNAFFDIPTSTDSLPAIFLFDENRTLLRDSSNTVTGALHQVHLTQDWVKPLVTYTRTSDGCTLEIKNQSRWANARYIRFVFASRHFLKPVIISVNEEMNYEQVGTLADTIKVVDSNIKSTRLDNLSKEVEEISQNIPTDEHINALIDAKINSIPLASNETEGF